jgi:DNA polymerase-4
MQKPDGLIGLLPSQLPRAIAHLELRDLPGVGARTEVRLNARGIQTMQQLLALDRKAMHALWNSVWGDRLYHWLRGAETGDDGAPVDSGVQKSLGHSHVLGPQYRTPEGAWAVAHKLLHKAAMRLRMERLTASSMQVSIRYALTQEQVASRQASGKSAKRHFSGLRHSGWGMEARFPPCQDTLTLLQALRGMWNMRPEGAEFARPFHVAVTMYNLIAESDLQPSLFADPGHRAELAATMDRLNMKYGNTTLHFAAMLPARESAPTRISFTQIPVKYGVDYM